MKRIAVTGGSGNIAYSLLFRIAHGNLYGYDTPISLHILEVDEMLPSLEGVKMELEDCAFPLLKEVKVGSDPFEIFGDVDLALLIGAKPRGPGMERRDLLMENGKIFIQQGTALNDSASPECKVLVVGNPCNTNCWIAREKAPNLKRKNFFAMTRLDENRAKTLLASKASVAPSAVTHMAIWGNHSATQVPDFTHALIEGKKATDVIKEAKWLKDEFITRVQQRGADVIKARGKSSAASAAHAVIESVRCFEGLDPSKDWFSLGVDSDKNPYGVRDDLIFSFPCILQNGSVQIVGGIKHDRFIEEKIKLSENELIEEQSQILSFAR